MPWSVKAQALLQEQYAAVEGTRVASSHGSRRACPGSRLQQRRRRWWCGAVSTRRLRRRRALCRRLPRYFAGPSIPSPTSSWHPSTSWRARGAVHVGRDHVGTWRRWPGSPPVDPELFLATPQGHSPTTRPCRTPSPGGRPSPCVAAKASSSSPWTSPGAGAACSNRPSSAGDGNTCASSMARNTLSPSNWSVCASAVLRQAIARAARVRAQYGGPAPPRGGGALYRVHECVFGVLALESEPVDPRL